MSQFPMPGGQDPTTGDPFLDPNIWKVPHVGQGQYPGAGQSPAGAGSSTLPASFGGPLPAGQTPPPGVNPTVVYTDASGKGYDPNQLSSAWAGGGAFTTDPLNARVPDILSQYNLTPGGSNPALATPTSLSPANTQAATGAASGFGTPVTQNPRNSAFLDLLMSKAQGNENVSANDPIITDQTNAYNASLERERRKYLSEVAEKGGAYGGIGAEARSSAERVGQGTGAFQANLMAQERTDRRKQITDMLSLYGGALSAQEQTALQEELHRLDLQQRAYEFDSNFFLNTSPFAAGMGA